MKGKTGKSRLARDIEKKRGENGNRITNLHPEDCRAFSRGPGRESAGRERAGERARAHKREIERARERAGGGGGGGGGGWVWGGGGGGGARRARARRGARARARDRERERERERERARARARLLRSIFPNKRVRFLKRFMSNFRLCSSHLLLEWVTFN
jgi:hypothetical protein